MAAHPELGDWFVERRTKRYEKFLNKVAMYMGANPQLFEGYLRRQEEILAELLRQYAEPHLVREVPVLSAVRSTASVTSEGGRRRAA